MRHKKVLAFVLQCMQLFSSKALLYCTTISVLCFAESAHHFFWKSILIQILAWMNPGHFNADAAHSIPIISIQIHPCCHFAGARFVLLRAFFHAFFGVSFQACTFSPSQMYLVDLVACSMPVQVRFLVFKVLFLFRLRVQYALFFLQFGIVYVFSSAVVSLFVFYRRIWLRPPCDHGREQVRRSDHVIGIGQPINRTWTYPSQDINQPINQSIT